MELNILIANCGNIRSHEIKTLAEALNKKHKVTIASHMQNKSNRALAFCYRDVPVRCNTVLFKDIVKNTDWIKAIDNNPKERTGFDGISTFEFGGDPADTISIMLNEILAHKKPDLVICGLNNGRHMGQDIYSSSNIAMAMEASFLGVPAVAVGVDKAPGGNAEKDLLPACEFIAKNAQKIAELKLPPKTFLNISIPRVEKYSDFKGVKVARMGKMTQLSKYIEKADPKGAPYYWADSVERKSCLESDPDAAPAWFEKGYITIVPLNYDLTDHDAVKEWNKVIGKDVAVAEGKK